MTRHVKYPLLIAEVANCHGGNEEYMEKLIDRLIKTGVDAIKFQPIIADEFIAGRHSLYSIFKVLEFRLEFWQDISGKVKASGKGLVFDLYGQDSLEMARACGADMYKIHAMDFDNLDFITKVLELDNPLLLSTGGATLEEVDRVVEISKGRPICLMVGFQSFPTPVEEANLNRIEFLQKRYGYQVGFMDHVGRDDPFAKILPCLALLRGACTVEKHVYLKDLETKYDWQSAFDPSEIDTLRELMVKTLEVGGKGEYVRSDLEYEYYKKCRRNAVAIMDIKKGEIVTLDKIKYLRAETPEGQRPVYRLDLQRFLNQPLKTEVLTGQTLTWEMFK